MIGTYFTAEPARAAVGFMVGNGFPVERTSIVGRDLHLEETVLSCATAHAARSGALTGVWFGLLSGLLAAPLARPSGSALGFAFGGLLYGVLFGVVFGLISLTTRGGHGLVSRQAVVADRYDIVADIAVANDARNLLARYNWRH
ncbi:PROBABLE TRANSMEMBRANE PROTEIN [[Actinomadura] parvosata subsp. kistnae]|uniref:general stress protein n=1 Tax=[Actinomadura] parvosata TaxID=1955412 RepID=UPI000D26DB72|nr:PROBABLE TRANSMEMBRANE PROTEIN [Actinomadura parvosata subsp. kistnae]